MSEQVAYWTVECEEQRGVIQLAKVRSVEGIILEPSYNLVQDCPFCKRKHFYMKRDITITLLPVGQ